MSTYRLTVNGTKYYLTPDDDVTAVKTALLTAVSSGGGFIDLVNTARVKVALLITANSTVQIEEFDNIDDIDELWQQPPASTMFNFDDWEITIADS
ncbi:MAG: hypothetical protein JWQ19_509 [Subtercola sp.]|nr:hypothetical protein [Subtercola sp.]